MSDEPENIVLVYLRRFDARLERIEETLTDMRQRLTALEIQVGNQAATEQSHYAAIMVRLDRHEARLERIGKVM